MGWSCVDGMLNSHQDVVFIETHFHLPLTTRLYAHFSLFLNHSFFPKMGLFYLAVQITFNLGHLAARAVCFASGKIV